MFITRDFTKKLNVHALRLDNPHISVPEKPNTEALAAFGVFNYISTPKPDFDEDSATEATPVVSSDTATQVWVSTPLTDPDKTSLKRVKVKELDSMFIDSIQTLDEKHSDEERRSFDQQRNEAEAWKNDNNALTPRLDKLAQARGIARQLMINKVLRKLQDIDVLYWGRLGHKQELVDNVKKLASNDPNFKSKLKAISW